MKISFAPQFVPNVDAAPTVYSLVAVRVGLGKGDADLPGVRDLRTRGTMVKRLVPRFWSQRPRH